MLQLRTSYFLNGIKSPTENFLFQKKIEGRNEEQKLQLGIYNFKNVVGRYSVPQTYRRN